MEFAVKKKQAELSGLHLAFASSLQTSAVDLWGGGATLGSRIWVCDI